MTKMVWDGHHPAGVAVTTPPNTVVLQGTRRGEPGIGDDEIRAAQETSSPGHPHLTRRILSSVL
ncbi:hypothetical protein OB905_10950 [Halobacteria archaeon AArc-dxtr1]|nr:hypothetical protein [Halobacteria archaeon AArc-dxtr1]